MQKENFWNSLIKNIFRNNVEPNPKISTLPVLKDLVLVGGGHSHVHVLKSFGMNPLNNLQITLISRDLMSPYSGMIPGYISGHYTYEDCHIDLCKLARFAKARFIHGEVEHIDADNKLIQVKDGRPPIPYDVCSINIGSSPRMIHTNINVPNVHITPVKPIDSFSARWTTIVERISASTLEHSLKFVVVGGGAGGVELVLAMQFRLRAVLRSLGKSEEFVNFTLVSSGPSLLTQHNKKVQDVFKRILAERGITLFLSKKVVNTDMDNASGILTCEDGFQIPFDECVWCTSASCQNWLQTTKFDLDSEGFILVQDTLESISTPSVFACGDCAHVVKHPRPKAGVFAVRQGPPLTENLRRKICGIELLPFTPQSTFLGLISTGDKYAVSSKAELCEEGAHLWTWKDEIDRKFMASYSSDLSFVMPEALPIGEVAASLGKTGTDAIEQSQMRCCGCGGKVAPETLAGVLSQLKVGTRSTVLAGISQRDDAAILAVPGNDKVVLLQTVDFLRTFISDPFVFGKIAALHALSDIYAMGGTPISALSTALVPYALESKMATQLHQMMSGAVAVLEEADCPLVGGHTHENLELGLGLAITGTADKHLLLRKGAMMPGDKLILSKPLGTGVIGAAEMRGKAKGTWFLGAMKSMLVSNRQAAQIFGAHGASACTDVTGFGLLGHLKEMVQESRNVAVELEMEALPILEGALECFSMGIMSSLHSKNFDFQANALDEKSFHHKAFPILFDPQTSGGLIASVPADRVLPCLTELLSVYPCAAVIGCVIEKPTDSALFFLN